MKLLNLVSYHADIMTKLQIIQMLPFDVTSPAEQLKSPRIS